MFQNRRAQTARLAVLGVFVFLGPAIASAQTAATAANGKTGRIDFATADLPPATVEVDLSQAIFGDLFGLGDAAIAGVAEALTQAEGSAVTKMAAEELAAARQIIDLAKDVVREVRVRVYENLAEGEGNVANLGVRFDQQLTDGQWDRVVRVNDGDDSVNVSLLRVEGSILGLFVVVADGSDVVLANVVCDISPENVKKISAAATKIGLKHGLAEKLERELSRHAH